MTLSVVIPAYNESKNIKTTIREVLSTLDKMPDIDRTEVLVVDDHSSDGTFEAAGGMDDSRVKCLRLSRRCGSHTALRAGMKESTGEAVLFTSADGQDDPACLVDMLKKWRKGAKVVWALRKTRRGEPWYITKPAQAFYRLLTCLGGVEKTDIDISRANFYLLDRIVVNAINNCLERHTSLFGLILWLGFNQDFVEYERRPRRSGKSKWNFRSSLTLAKDWIMGFSGLPLTLMFLVGIVITGVGILYALYMVANIILGNPAESPAVIILAILLVGGIQLITLGLVGEYLWHNLDESRRRPLYLIEKRSERL